MSVLQKRLTRGFLLLFWMGVIFAFSAQPNSNEVTENIFGGINYFVRKGSHMTEYAILYWLALWFEEAFIVRDGAAQAGDAWHRPYGAGVFVFLYACSDEWHQSFVPGRTALFSDVLIDCSGACIAALIAWVLRRRI